MIGSINKLIKRFVGDKAEKDIKLMNPLVDKTNEFFATYATLTNDELRGKAEELKQRIADYIAEEEDEIKEIKAKADEEGVSITDKEDYFERIDKLTETSDEKLEEVLNDILPEAFATIKETARRFMINDEVEVTASQMDKDLAAERDAIEIHGDKAHWKTAWNAAGAVIKWEMVHYDVQLIGGVAMHQGKIAEMQTGEGKTLVATLPMFLNALAGRGVHLVTVNDYLARRDSEWMGPIFEFHGLTVDCIDKHRPNSEERRNAYKADITYGTNNEFGFDYLRDNMASEVESLVQRKPHYAIVDEVDSVLVDEARTPLIISGPTPKGDEHEFDALKPKIQAIVNAQKQLALQFLADAKIKLKGIAEGEVSKEDAKEGGMSLLRAFRGLPKNKALIKYLSEEGVRAQLLKTEGFYMQDNSREMHLVDAELLFMIDEKTNAIELQPKGLEIIGKDLDDDNFFIMPDVGSDMADIENGEGSDEDKLAKKQELMNDFGIKSQRVHTINQLLKAYTLFEKDIEYVVMDNKVKIVDEQTGRIMEGRRYSDGLHQAIESKENVKVEAVTQTYATVTLQNFFRMYHKLSGMTGTAETEAGELWDIYKLDVVIIPTNRPITRDDRDDLLFRTKREKYNAVIDEIVKLTEQGRPVLVGTTNVEVSELLGKMLDMRDIKHNVLNAKMHQREAEIVAEAGNDGQITIATNMAGRGTDIKLSAKVKAAGGLAIVGTERHDSRRVDRQLRGRAGRQGDPGSSQFFVSLEDDLMRLFGSDRTAKVMDRMGFKEGEVIQHGMITKSIERAQKKVEENNFGVRKRLLEYDDVMNAQREVIYKRRRNGLDGERLKLDLANMFYDMAQEVVSAYSPTKDFENFKLATLARLSIDTPFSQDEFDSKKPEELTGQLYVNANANYEKRAQSMADQAFPVIARVFEDEANSYTNMAVPFSDGRKQLNIVANIEKAHESKAKTLVEDLEKGVTLSVIDNKWKEHLRNMDDLRQNVQFASHEQKDPLLIYKFESYELFKKMISEVNEEVSSFLMKCSLPINENQVQGADSVRKTASPQGVAQKSNVMNSSERAAAARSGGNPNAAVPRPKAQPIRVEAKVGRNEPCPCGSGKKFKSCHGKQG
ncbi:MAG TPA: preprotein translocase subunit SecA [Flavobacteriales bacterium]|nr:preprotein translocase subunit SecA [Flavobacteriales bacterium]|tara:strand:- start:1211 stop:4558 length:3348 start_codon:yes stop_codon:yes gene_type:complete